MLWDAPGCYLVRGPLLTVRIGPQRHNYFKGSVLGRLSRINQPTVVRSNERHFGRIGISKSITNNTVNRSEIGEICLFIHFRI